MDEDGHGDVDKDVVAHNVAFDEPVRLAVPLAAGD